MTRRTLGLFAILASMFALVAACGSDPTPTPTQEATPTPTTSAGEETPTPGDDFQAEWDALVAAAQEEGELEVFICCALGREFDEHVQAFQDEFGIQITSATGSSRQQADRVLEERRAGLYSLDVWTGGISTTNTRLIPEGALQDIRDWVIHPSVTNPDNWYFDGLFWGDPEKKYIIGFGGNGQNAPIAYNTEKLEDPTVIQSYHDILNERFVGEIVMRDPREAGTANQHPFYWERDLVDSYLVPLFRDMEVRIASDARQAAEWLAQGQYTLCLFTCTTEVEALEAEGLPVSASFPHPLEEGATISTGGNNIFVLDSAPHPNAAKLFLNWFLTEESQYMYQGATGDDSLRVDIEKDNVLPGSLRRDDIEYDVSSADAEHQQAIDEALEWFRTELPKYGY